MAPREKPTLVSPHRGGEELFKGCRGLIPASMRALTGREAMKTAKDDEGRAPETIELPAPTAWPMVTALGVTLLLGGSSPTRR
jgi:hypothetical protein